MTGVPSGFTEVRRSRVGGSNETSAVSPCCPSQPRSFDVLAKKIVVWDLSQLFRIRLTLCVQVETVQPRLREDAILLGVGEAEAYMPCGIEPVP